MLRWGYKSSKFTHYLLVDREGTKKALDVGTLTPEEIMDLEGPINLPQELFEIIVGFNDIKETIVKSLKAEKPVHILLAGPPATGAKTLFMDELQRLEGARYTLGSSDTKAGITRFLMENKPRIVIVDELDKMDRDDYAALLSLMETGIVTEMKFGRTATIRLKTWIFGACNEAERLPAELKSRFLVFFLKPYGEQEFIEVVTRTLVRREGADQELASYIAKQLASKTKDPRAAVKIARLCKTREEVDGMIRMLIQYRGL